MLRGGDPWPEGAAPVERGRTLREPSRTMESDVDLFVTVTINRLLLTEVFILDQRYLPLYTGGESKLRPHSFSTKQNTQTTQ